MNLHKLTPTAPAWLARFVDGWDVAWYHPDLNLRYFLADDRLEYSGENGRWKALARDSREMYVRDGRVGQPIPEDRIEILP